MPDVPRSRAAHSCGAWRVAAIPSTIHVVDDDPSILRALARLFRSAGFAVETFVDAESYLAADAQAPRCLIVDVGLPGMSGLELTAIVAKRWADVPVIVISAHDDEQVRGYAHSLGVAEFFAKPLTDDGFLQAVENAAASST